jgi:hypothetical protein
LNSTPVDVPGQLKSFAGTAHCGQSGAACAIGGTVGHAQGKIVTHAVSLAATSSPDVS